MEQLKLNTQQLAIAGAVFAVVVIVGYYYWSSRTPDAPATDDIANMQNAVEEENKIITDIGASAETATLKNAIPTVVPTTNPIKNIYKNPFE